MVDEYGDDYGDDYDNDDDDNGDDDDDDDDNNVEGETHCGGGEQPQGGRCLEFFPFLLLRCFSTFVFKFLLVCFLKLFICINLSFVCYQTLLDWKTRRKERTFETKRKDAREVDR